MAISTDIRILPSGSATGLERPKKPVGALTEEFHDITTPTAYILPGTKLNCSNSLFVVKRFINKGGMAKVYEVCDKDGKTHAAKVLNEDLLGSVFLKRFEREAELLKGLKGEKHIISFTDSGKYNNQPFFVMEYADGGSLKEAMKQKEPKEILEIIATFCPVLERLHKKGIIHRDLKPSNILFKDGIPKLSDFGVAANICNVGVMNEKEASSHLTATNDLIGTPSHMAPEQAKSALIVLRKIQSAQSLDDAKDGVRELGKNQFTNAVDFYSLAVIMYQALTGNLPIEEDGETREQYLDKVVEKIPVSISTLVPDIDNPNNFGKLIMRLLSKNPNDRSSIGLRRLEKEIREHIKKLQ